MLVCVSLLAVGMTAFITRALVVGIREDLNQVIADKTAISLASRQDSCG